MVFGLIQFAYLCLSLDFSYADFMFYNKVPVILFYIWLLFFIARNTKGILTKYILAGNILLLIFGTVAWSKASFSDAAHPWPGILNHLFTLPFAVVLEIIVFTFALAIRLRLELQKSWLSKGRWSKTRCWLCVVR